MMSPILICFYLFISWFMFLFPFWIFDQFFCTRRRSPTFSLRKKAWKKCPPFFTRRPDVCSCMEAAGTSPADTNQPAVGDGTGWEMRYRKVMDRLKAPKDETTLSLEPGVCCRETRSLNSTKVKQDSILSNQQGFSWFCHMGVSKNRGKTPQSIHLFIGFFIIFTIHFGW